jgi:hypothetical protein
MNKQSNQTVAMETQVKTGSFTRMATFPKRTWAVAVLLAAAGATVATKPARAQDGQGQANGLVGSWRVTVNVTDPAGFPSFPVLMTFHADGTMLQSRLSYIPAFGVIETTAHGAWKPLNVAQIAATTFALVQGAPGNTALNGAFVGTEKVNFQPVIASDGNSFTALWTSTVYDPSGNPIVLGSGNLSGVRVQVER